MSDMVLLDIDGRGVATVTMNRPELHNAFNEDMIAQLTEMFAALDQNDAVRVVVLTGKGASFSAGGDLNWMKKFVQYSHAENMADAMKLAVMLKTLDRLSKPTIAAVNGATFAGGVGLLSCCDLVVAVETAIFAVSEVKIGLAPATISPYVVAAIGARAARRYFLTGERFDAGQAQAIGLVHEVAADHAALTQTVDGFIKQFLGNGQTAMTASKDLVFAVMDRAVDDALMTETARRIADRRISAEGQEGLAAFLEKRKPNWVKG
ncbi:enoyl-CoA hydratase/isomerase family protein [Govanella unica]|uniref:Enoyl-CoA hydratase/isomerase family protein n=1 Tax=Govanella unica TaxID=2975056 RepID=A0A9X3Z627_9PROT|nr:enoyl-CoA hydratase/isomerase family protein [Govania unica]MDA5192573.1 enoyl-CoA hydratase/isomerase family protein [Govania unica]